MSLSDCDKCWETPCICGYEYRNLSYKNKLKLAAVILGLTERQLENAISIINNTRDTIS